MENVVGIIVAVVLLAYAAGATFWALHQQQKIEELRLEARRAMTRPADTPPEHRPLLSDEIQAKLIERLLDTALPTPPPPPTEEDMVRSSAEYEPPPIEVSDWTDPFFQLDRPLVAGLAPGQAIPGIGDNAGEDLLAGYDVGHLDADAWERLENHPEANGMVDAARLGEEMFDAWEDSR